MNQMRRFLLAEKAKQDAQWAAEAGAMTSDLHEPLQFTWTAADYEATKAVEEFTRSLDNMGPSVIERALAHDATTTDQPPAGPSLRALTVEAVAREYQEHIQDVFGTLVKDLNGGSRTEAAAKEAMARFQSAVDRAARAYRLALPVTEGLA